MVSVDEPTATPALQDVARAYRAVEPLHNHVYFAPETEQELTAIGLRPGRMCYFAGRAAPMGPVGPGTVTATFFNFAPSLVARHIPRAWSLAGTEQILAARLAAARASLTRLLGGPEAAAEPEIAELAGLLREACSVLTPEGRALYAGHADQPWPDEPLLQVWHGASLLREYRGDGHLTALLRADLSGLEALISHTATGRGFLPEAARIGRGWTEEEWAAGCAALDDRGLLDEGGLTDAGRELRARLEAETDVLSADPWLFLGPERTARVIEIGKALSTRLRAAGAYPENTFSGR
jgi:hypothetical protein